MKAQFDFHAAIIAARTTSVETFMQVALALVPYAPAELEAYAASQERGDCQKLLKALGSALPDVYENEKLVMHGFTYVYKTVATEHERNAMTAAWRGMTAAQFLAKNNARKQKKPAPPVTPVTPVTPETPPAPTLQAAPAATLIKGKAQSATDSRAIDVAHKILDADYKPTRAELVLLAEALLGESE